MLRIVVAVALSIIPVTASAQVGVPIPPVAIDVDLGDVAGTVITHQFTVLEGSPPLTWSNLLVTSGSPASAPTLTPDGAFKWDTSTSTSPALYSFQALVSNSVGSDTALLSLNLIAIPEPSTLTLMGLATVGLLGYGCRKRWLK